MNHFSHILQNRRLLVSFIALAVLLVILALIVVISPWEGSVTPQQARTEVSRFVDSTFAQAMPEHTPTPGFTDGDTGTCYDPLGGLADAHHLTYDRVVTDFDPASGDEIVTRVEQFWRDQGLDVNFDNAIEGVTIMISRSDEFNYRLTVNRNDPLVSMVGQTPCISETEWAEAGIP